MLKIRDWQKELSRGEKQISTKSCGRKNFSGVYGKFFKKAEMFVLCSQEAISRKLMKIQNAMIKKEEEEELVDSRRLKLNFWKIYIYICYKSQDTKFTTFYDFYILFLFTLLFIYLFINGEKNCKLSDIVLLLSLYFF